MLLIEVLGTGCPKCLKLTENAEKAVERLDFECKINKVTDINDILAYGIMITPALAVNGDIKSSGKVLSPDEIVSLLTKENG